MMRSKVDAIFIADVHLREDTPLCRQDDFQKDQWNKLRRVKKLQKTYNCPVICSGDLFHISKPSPWLLSQTLKHLPGNFMTVYGNHDLPRHNIDLQYFSGIYVLEVSRALTVLPGRHWEQDFSGYSCIIGGRKVMVTHEFVYQNKQDWMDLSTHLPTNVLFKRYPEADVILSGDNHESFVVKNVKTQQLLVNPGGFTRQRTSEAEYHPRIALYSAEENEIEWYEFPWNPEAVTSQHIHKKQDKEDKIQAFVSHFNKDIEISESFNDNLEKLFDKNQTPSSVRDIIYGAM